LQLIIKNLTDIGLCQNSIVTTQCGASLLAALQSIFSHVIIIFFGLFFYMGHAIIIRTIVRWLRKLSKLKNSKKTLMGWA